MDTESLQPIQACRRVLNDDEIDNIKKIVDGYINGNIIIRNLVKSFPNAQYWLSKIPIILAITAKDNEGYEILKESGLIDAIKKKD